ncbi:energy-coupling factor transporter transmembrane protein EcfT [Corynebacterium sp. sy039]|uniref:energy-coupling factor transporter transmembrane component T family protein n=1 Tax=Corynebacterium sp. sy039 TaxID=2599641 RepID=UPI0011B83D8C|nr:energy-coupling factor transporter transmembrane component T [Corynebacterium sp. sy039]QDZ42350.1 hypothetical protein FQV43_03630 [Corynebacterium sp. sy039]
MKAINPLTALVCGFSSWILILGINHFALSLVVIASAWIIGVAATRNFSVVFSSLMLSLPFAFSVLIIHAPYGEYHILPFVTSDGLLVSAQLSLRFCALMAAVLSAMTFSSVPLLVKAIQATNINHKLSYILGATLQFLPQATQAVQAMKEARILAGYKSKISIYIGMLIPVIVYVLSQGAQRTLALDLAGVDRPGPRTILRPVPDTKGQQIARLLIPIIAVVIVVAVKVLLRG